MLRLAWRREGEEENEAKHGGAAELDVEDFEAWKDAGLNEAERVVLHRGSNAVRERIRVAQCKGARHTRHGLVPWVSSVGGLAVVLTSSQATRQIVFAVQLLSARASLQGLHAAAPRTPSR